ncbi:MAG: hypothetical protein WA919_13780, partial [Coleofasciculaceae cyanobacterium]
LKFAQYYLDSGFVCLLAEHRWYLTVWLEDQKANLINNKINTPTSTEKNHTKVLSKSAKSKIDKDITTNDSYSPSDSQPPDSQEVSENYEQQESSLEKSIPQSETNIETLVQPQANSELDKNSSNDFSKNDKKPSKKRRVRRYRGISY